MIEMKDFQEVMGDEEFGVEELSSSNNNNGKYCQPPISDDSFDDEFHSQSSDGPSQPGTWCHRRLRKQNRRMIIFMGVVLILAAVVYVGTTVYMSEDDVDSLVQPFDRESGIVQDGAENEKQQQAIEDAGAASGDNHKHHNGKMDWGGHKNPFASQVNVFKQQSFQNGQDNGHEGREGSGTIDKMGHNGSALRPGGAGGFGHHGHNGAFSGGGQSQNQKPQQTGTENEPSSSPTTKSNSIEVDEKDVYCEDLTQYDRWYNASVTKNDGAQFRVIQQFDHDEKAFTQGLTYGRGVLFESTGTYGKSTVRIIDPDTANVVKKVPLDGQFFGEGITYYKDTLVQITWKKQIGFIYNMTTLETIDQFSFSSTKNEGWGITWDRCKDELIVTDGSPYLHFWDPGTMKEKRKIRVIRMDGKEAFELNEIEFWRGRILANIWYEDVLVVIHPETGEVEKEYDFSTIWSKDDRKQHRADVFNGISVSRDPNALYVTGKNWDRMFTVELLPSIA